MNHSDAQNMQSYPSPNVGPADDNGGDGIAFYSNSGQPQQSSNLNSDELQLTAQLSRSVAPNMNVGAGTNAPDGQDHQRPSPGHGFEHHGIQLSGHPAHIQSPPSEGNEPMGVYHHGGQGERAGKRTKVSRACDECRRKKIRCDAQGEEGQEICTSCKRIGTQCQFTRLPLKRGPSKGYIKELADRVDRLETEGAYAPRPLHGSEVAVATQYIPHPSAALDHGQTEEYPSAISVESGGRKRTYSSVSRDYNPPFPARPPFINQETPRNAQQSSNQFSPMQLGPKQSLRDQAYPPGGLQPPPTMKNTSEPAHRRSSSSYHSPPPAEQPQAQDAVDTVYDAAVFEKYHTLIHRSYPILHADSNKIVNLVSGCSASLKLAFYSALSVTVSTLAASSLADIEDGGAKKAADLLLASHYEFSPVLSFSNELVRIQTMILLALEAEARGPAPLGPRSGDWLARAIALAYTIKLHVFKKAQENKSSSESELYANVPHQVWCTLVIMDRWHSASTLDPTTIPDDAISFYYKIQEPGKDHLYYLTRLSMVVGHFAQYVMALNPISPWSPELGRAFLRVTKGELDILIDGMPRYLIENPAASPLMHLCHAYFLVQLYTWNPDSQASDVLAHALRVVLIIEDFSEILGTPLAHHAVCLATIVLIELSRHDETKEKATAGLTAMLKMRVASPAWDNAIKEMINKSRATASGENAATSAHASLASQGLQHLAELATASTGDDGKESNDTAHTQPDIREGLKVILRDSYMSRFRG